MQITIYRLCLTLAFFTLSGSAEEPSVVVEKIQKALQAENPDYEGKGKFLFRDGKLYSINLTRCRGITNLAPLGEFDLGSVGNVSIYNAINISDLTPLRKCRITQLNTERCAKLTDLSPIQGMPIKWFRMYACGGIKDIAPLRGMPLEHLDIGLNPHIKDLSVLKGMALHDLRLDNCTALSDISVIKGMPLKFLSIFGCTGIKDFSPIVDLPLETLFFSPDLLSEKDLQQVREMPSLKILGTSWEDYGKKLSPAQFWARHDSISKGKP